MYQTFNRDQIKDAGDIDLFILLDMDPKRAFQLACHRRDKHSHQMTNVRDDKENPRVLSYGVVS